MSTNLHESRGPDNHPFSPMSVVLKCFWRQQGKKVQTVLELWRGRLLPYTRKNILRIKTVCKWNGRSYEVLLPFLSGVTAELFRALTNGFIHPRRDRLQDLWSLPIRRRLWFYKEFSTLGVSACVLVLLTTKKKISLWKKWRGQRRQERREGRRGEWRGIGEEEMRGKTRED